MYKINRREILLFLSQGLYLLSAFSSELFSEDQSVVPIGHEYCKRQKDSGSFKQIWQIGEKRPFIPNTEKAQLAKFRELLFSVVKKNILFDDVLGLELSGGLDSSSVCASLRCIYSNRDLHALSHALPLGYNGKLKQSDELMYSRCVAQKFNIDHSVVRDGFHFHDILPLYANILGTFSQVLYPILNHRLFEVAKKKGVSVLFSGFGGDEIVTQQATQYLNELKSKKQCLALIRAIGVKSCLKKSINKLLNRKQLFTERFIEDLSDLIQPCHRNFLALRNKADFSNYPSVHAVAYDVLHGKYSGHLHARVCTSQKIAAHYGIKMRFPLLDPDLLDYWYHLPPSLLRRNGQGRWLMRQAMKGILPENVRLRRDKTASTCGAASLAFDKVLPDIFLERITPNYEGQITEYLNIQKLINLVKLPGEKSDALKRLCVCVLMVDYLDHQGVSKNKEEEHI